MVRQNNTIKQHKEIMSHLLKEDLFKNIKASPRGGYRNHIGYDDCDLVATHFHYVCDGGGNPLTDISALPFMTRLLLADFTETTREIAINDFGAIIGETCVRVLWYPKQATKHKNKGQHKDYCWLTVPLYDSHNYLGKAFYSEMAEYTGDGVGELHSFDASSRSERLYVVGFVQLPFDTAIDRKNNTTYVDVLNYICAKNDRHANQYKIAS